MERVGLCFLLCVGNLMLAAASILSTGPPLPPALGIAVYAASNGSTCRGWLASMSFRAVSVRIVAIATVTQNFLHFLQEAASMTSDLRSPRATRLT
ncbi:MAG: hypothetical protein WCA38_06235 [Candidatus Acidiferrales bacterium]